MEAELSSGNLKWGMITFCWRSSCNASVSSRDLEFLWQNSHTDLEGITGPLQGQSGASSVLTFVIALLQRDGICWGYQGSSHPWNNSGLPAEEPHNTLCAHTFKLSFTGKKKVRNISLKGWLSPEQKVVESRILQQGHPCSEQTPYYTLNANSHSWEQSPEKK